MSFTQLWSSRRRLLTDEQIGDQSTDRNDFVKDVVQPGCQVEAGLVDTCQLSVAVLAAITVAA